MGNMEHLSIYEQAVKAVSVKFNFLYRTKRAQAVKGFVHTEGGEIAKGKNGKAKTYTKSYTASGARCTTDYTRAKAGALLSQIYTDCIKAGYSPEQAYNTVCQTTKDFGDYDIADMLQIAVFELWQSNDFLAALRELDKYLSKLTQRAPMSEEDIERQYAKNLLDLAKSTAYSPEIDKIIDAVRNSFTGLTIQIIDLALCGYAKKEIARELDIQPKTVRYHLAKVGAELIKFPEIQRALSA